MPRYVGGRKGWRSGGGRGKGAGGGWSLWRLLATVLPLALEVWQEWRAKSRDRIDQDEGRRKS